MSRNRKTTFYLETLGCPRNEADSEAIINILKASGFQFVQSPEKVDIIIVNGCAFVSDAVEESIDSILSLRDMNKEATLAVVGCFAQRYGSELLEAMDEIDLLIGTGSYKKISALIAAHKTEVNCNYGFLGKNLYIKSHVTPSHYRYIKIQEGCDYRCAFCIIPQLKGVSRSKELQIIKEEVSNLPETVKEIILIGQNTTSWGKDLSDNKSLSNLIEEVAPIFPGWIRLLYFHPLSVDEELLLTMKRFPNVVNYLDIPFQHISDSVLANMNRGYGRDKVEELMGMIQSTGDFTIRSTFIVGFPSETEENFGELISFIEKSSIEHIGTFPYSHEEGSASFTMRELPGKIVMRRLKIISKLIEERMIESNKKLIGKPVEVLIDGIEQGEYYGRIKTSAPDIDPVVWILSSKQKIVMGNVYKCSITGVAGGDFTGEIVSQ